MKRKNIIIALILFLAIGFAAVTTTLYINGTISFKPDEDDFDVYFVRAETEDNIECYTPLPAADLSNSTTNPYGLPGRVEIENEPSINMLTNYMINTNANLELLDAVRTCEDLYLNGGYSDYSISQDGKTLSFYTGELSVVGDSSKIGYEIYNNSTQYDADVKMSCTVEENNYVTVSNSIDSILLEAKASAIGELEVVLNRVVDEPTSIAINCEIDATATERDTLNIELSPEGEVISYNLYGSTASSISDFGNDLFEDSELLKDYTVVLYPEAISTTSDENGWFFIEDVKGGGIHTIYYIEGTNVENIEGLTEEEIANLSLSKAVFYAEYINVYSDYYDYNNHYISFENDYVLFAAIDLNEQYNITFDANGGSVDVTTMEVTNVWIENLPIPTREGYTFDGWHYSLEIYDEVSKYDRLSSDITVYAQWKKCETNDSGIEMCWNDLDNSETKTVGDIVSFASENFYIYSVSDTEIQLITRDAIVWSEFSNETYHGEELSDYVGSLAEKHVNEYSEYLLNDLGITNSARLISKEEIDAMAEKTLADDESLDELGLPAFLYGNLDNGRYWTSSVAEGTNYVWVVYSIPNKIMSTSVLSIRGIRPVITISADLLN